MTSFLNTFLGDPFILCALEKNKPANSCFLQHAGKFLIETVFFFFKLESRWKCGAQLGGDCSSCDNHVLISVFLAFSFISLVNSAKNCEVVP